MTIGLQFEARSEGGFRVRSSSGADGIQLGIGRAHAEARGRKTTAVALPWPSDASPSKSQWGISQWAWVKQWQRGKSNAAGVAVLVTGDLRISCARLIRETSDLGHRISEHDQAYGIMPIVRSSSPAHTCEAERDTLRALVSLLQRRRDLRERLDDHQRMNLLVAELNSGCVPRPTTLTTVTRDRIDIRTAISQAALVHRHGRPLPGETTVPCTDAVARVLDVLGSNRHRGDRPIDESLVTAMVCEAYCDITPWPFTALVT